MKSTRRCLRVASGVLAVVLIMLSASVSEAAAKKKKAPKKKPAAKKKAKGGKAQSYFSDQEIYDKLEVSSKQGEKFQAARQKLQEALDKWDASPKGQRLSELEVLVDSAGTPEEKRKAAGYASQIRQLKRERSAIEKRYEPQILAALTPKQKGVRHGYKLCNKLLNGKLAQVMQGDQANKLRGYCMQAGNAVAKGSLSLGRAEAKLQSLAVGMLKDDQKKKLGIRVQPKEDKNKKNNKRNNRRRNNNKKKKKPTKQQIEAYKKAQAQKAEARKKALAAQKG